MNKSQIGYFITILAILIFITGCSEENSSEPEQPQLSVQSNGLNFTRKVNSDNLIISKIGEGELSWEITDMPIWLEASKNSGKLTTDNETIIITADITQPLGSYNSTINISSNGEGQEVSVSLEISEWFKMKDLTTSRWRLSSCAVNGKIYAIGGVGKESKVEEYDIANDIWTNKASMHTRRSALATIAVNGKIYAIGGSGAESGYFLQQPTTEVAATEMYDPVTDTWISKTDMPTAREGVCAGVVDEKIYVFGGLPPVNKNEMYDPVTDTWTEKQQMPTARWGPTSGVVNGKIYVFGGRIVQSREVQPRTDVVEMYDPATDTWSAKAPMPEPRAAHATAVVNGQIHIFGGKASRGGSGTNNHWIYDPTSDTWDTSLPNMPFNWSNMGYAEVNERVYLMAGSEVNWPHEDNLLKVYEYYP